MSEVAKSLLLASTAATSGGSFDPDAASYIAAVESADGQSLEDSIKVAYNNFVLGCKSDGIWTAIKASCILAGARTLAGALTPLVGTAPTNVGFVSGDYDRKTGLLGDGSSYLDSNRLVTADGQNDNHYAAWVTVWSGNSGALMGSDVTSSNSGITIRSSASGSTLLRNNTTFNITLSSSNEGPLPRTSTLMGISRTASNSYNWRLNNDYTGTRTDVSSSQVNVNVYIFRNNGTDARTNYHRMAFYSMGSSLDLALLDSRVTTLINDIAAAIP